MSFRIGIVAACACLLAACASTADVRPTPTATPTPSASPTPEVSVEPTPTAPPGTTPFPTPGPTITPGSTRVIGMLRRADGSPAKDVCVVLEKGLCPIGTDAEGMWFTDVPAGPINWNFIYKVGGQEVGRQFVLGTAGGELHLGLYTLTD